VSEALHESQVRKAQRIGRLAADEGLDHDAAHAIADETERLAAIEAANALRRARPPWVGVLLVCGAVLAVGVFATRITTDTFEITPGSIIGLLGVLLVVIDVIWGSSFVRIGVALRLRWLYRSTVPVRFTVLQSYSEQRLRLGAPGCECVQAFEGRGDDEG